MTTEVFFREGTIEIWAYFKRAGVLYSPNQGVKLTLTDPDGEKQVDNEAMDPSEEGKFVYYYTPPADAKVKWWKYRCKGQDGTEENAKYGVGKGSFELKE